MQVMNTIQAHLQQMRSDSLMLSLTGTGGSAYTIDAQTKIPLASPIKVQLVRYTDGADVEITAGENSGRAITYRNIVTRWDEIGTWDGAEPLSLTVQIDGGDKAVVILQEPGPGRVLAAARAQ